MALPKIMPLTETVALIEMQSLVLEEKRCRFCSVLREGAHGWKSIEEVVLPCSINTRFCRQNCGGLCVLVASRVIRNQICSFDSPFFVRVQNKLSFVKVLPGCGRCLFMQRPPGRCLQTSPVRGATCWLPSRNARPATSMHLTALEAMFDTACLLKSFGFTARSGQT